MDEPRDTSHGDFEGFQRFLDEWSRRDFLKGLGGAAAFRLVQWWRSSPVFRTYAADPARGCSGHGKSMLRSSRIRR